MPIDDLAKLFGTLIFLIGFPGLYAFQAIRAGRLGLAGFCLSFFGLAILEVSTEALFAFTGPVLAAHHETRFLVRGAWNRTWVLVAAGLGQPAEHALILLLALNGLRVSEATGANIQAIGVERGHRTLVITRKGGKVVTIPLAPRTARAIDLAVGERSDGPLFLAPDASGWVAGSAASSACLAAAGRVSLDMPRPGLALEGPPGARRATPAGHADQGSLHGMSAGAA